MGKCFNCNRNIGWRDKKYRKKDFENFPIQDTVIDKFTDKNELCQPCAENINIKNAVKIYQHYEEFHAKSNTMDLFYKMLDDPVNAHWVIIALNHIKQDKEKSTTVKKHSNSYESEISDTINESEKSDIVEESENQMIPNNTTGNSVTPYSLRPMVESSLTGHVQYPEHLCTPREIEYGNEKSNKWTSTLCFTGLPVLANGEEVVWSYVKTDGVFTKKATEVWAITNLRAIIYFFDNPDQSGYGYLTLFDDVIVMNSHRTSTSHRMGSFSSSGRYGMRVGTGSSIGQSKSQTVGDVVFMKDGDDVLRFGGVADPSGIAKVAKSIKKSVQVRDKAPDFSQLELPDELKDSSIPTEELVELIRSYDDLTSDEKIKKYTEVVKKYHDKFFYMGLIDQLQSREKWEEMEIVSREMVQKNRHELAVESLCVSLFNQDKTDEAITEMKKGLTFYPDNKKLQLMREQTSDYVSSRSEVIVCMKCKTDNPKDSKFCNKCGKKLDEGCSQCGHVNPKNAKFCNSCGFVLK